MNVFAIDLEARKPPENKLRFYRIEAGPNLFGEWIVELQYGRIGTKGRVRSFLVADENAGRKMVRACLQRRQSAPRRIGVEYHVVDKFDPDGWLEK